MFCRPRPPNRTNKLSLASFASATTQEKTVAIRPRQTGRSSVSHRRRFAIVSHRVAVQRHPSRLRSPSFRSARPARAFASPPSSRNNNGNVPWTTRQIFLRRRESAKRGNVVAAAVVALGAYIRDDWRSATGSVSNHRILPVAGVRKRHFHDFTRIVWRYSAFVEIYIRWRTESDSDRVNRRKRSKPRYFCHPLKTTW